MDYLRGYLQQVSLAIDEDHIPVFGYHLWSLYDNMEWSSAYSLKFGIVRVDCTSNDLSRYVKRSAQFYSEYILQARGADGQSTAEYSDTQEVERQEAPVMLIELLKAQ